MSDQQRVSRIQQALHKLGDGEAIVIRPAACCGDPTNLDGGAHPWQHVSEDGPGDVYHCPQCGAVDVD